MSRQTTQEILHHARIEYRQCFNRKQKTHFILRTQELLGYKCVKSVIRSLNRTPQKRKKEKRGRKPILSKNECIILKKLWFAMDQPCGKRMHAMLKDWIIPWENKHGQISSKTRYNLLNISSSSIDRALRSFKSKETSYHSHGALSGLKAQIPIIDTSKQVVQSGHFYADTVAHGGNSCAGDFVWTLTMTDGHTQWTSNRAVWNKGQYGVCKAIESIIREAPFRLRSINTDNGSEFINHHLQRHFKQKHPRCKITRSRPYKKNDNAKAEEKNRRRVRNLIGYERLDDERFVKILNRIYKISNLLANHFNACIQLISKHREGSKIIKRYDVAKTPYQRIYDEMKPGKKKERLSKIHQQLNPISLRETLDKELACLYSLINNKSREEGGYSPPSPLGKVRPCIREINGEKKTSKKQ